SAQASAVAKLIQRFDNLSVTSREALQASPRFTYQKVQFGKFQFCRSTAVVPRARLVKGKNT
ncbi:MAG TPA: hypothetical protein VH392_06700, partial [Sphingomicrobium sp.]